MLKKFLFSALAALPLAVNTLPSAVVRLDPVVEGQVFRGFGTCLVPWVGDMVRLYETQSFQEIYAKELNFNLLRVDVMPYVHPEVTDPDDIRYQNFNIRSGGKQHADNARAGVFLDFAREIHAENPDTRVLLTVWSFPDWIKNNNSHLNGGAPKPTHYEHAAALLTEYVKQYENEGVPVLGVSFANEPQFAQFYNSQVIDPAPYADILSVVGKRLEDAGKGHVMIYGPEHMTFRMAENNRYVRAITAHEDAAGYLDAFASHGYLDGITSDPSSTAAARLWNEIASPNGWEFWMTEGGTGDHSYDASLDELAGMIHHHLAEANASVFTPWQVSGSERSGHNLMEMSTFTPKTRAMQHYSSVIEPGMTRIPASSDGNVRVTAFGDRATGELGIVLLNVENAAEEVTLDVPYLDLAGLDGVRTTSASAFEDLGTIPVSDGTSTLTVPARSIVSLSAEGVGFEDIPVLTVNNGEMRVQVPGYASELSIPVAIEDEAYPWSASLSSRRWAEIVAGESGTGSGAISVAFEDNFSDTHERAVDLTVNGLTLSIVQAPYTDPPVSWWEAVAPDSATGARDTASLSPSHAGIGWVHDDLWPFLYVHSLGGWTWVSSAYGNPASFYAYSFKDRSWVWMSAETGWAYRFEDPAGWILVAG